MSKVVFSVVTRDRAHRWSDVERCIRAAFAQTYSPMEIVLSDQGSSDGTLEQLEKIAAEYSGPNTVRVLSCPETSVRGMAGLNAHLAWLMGELKDCEYFVQCSDDDYSEPQRTARSIEAMERTGADMVGTALYFAQPGEASPASRSAFAREGWVTMRDLVEQKVGGSSAHCWRRSLWERVQPIPALCGVDVWLPALACALGGFWYVNEPLHTYVCHADAGNTGLEGAMRALPESERSPVDEHRLFQTAGAWQWVLRRMESLKVGAPTERGWVKEAALAHYEAWLDVRTEMTVKRIAPQPFRI